MKQVLCERTSELLREEKGLRQPEWAWNLSMLEDRKLSWSLGTFGLAVKQKASTLILPP